MKTQFHTVTDLDAQDFATQLDEMVNDEWFIVEGSVHTVGVTCPAEATRIIPLYSALMRKVEPAPARVV